MSLGCEASGMVKQPTYSFNLLNLARIVAVALLILYFLPWLMTTWAGPLSGASLVLMLAGRVFSEATAVYGLAFIFMLGWGFIPIGAIISLVLSFYRQKYLPLLSILTSLIGIIPFILMAILGAVISNWYFPMILTGICLLVLIVVGIKLYRQSPLSSAF